MQGALIFASLFLRKNNHQKKGLTMDWETQLIFVYVSVCNFFEQDKEKFVLRNTPNSKPVFTDEEAITVLIYGIIALKSDIKSIHKFAENHLKEFFPKLTKYEAFNHRLNFLRDEIIRFSQYFFQEINKKLDNNEKVVVVDSLPIILSKGSRAFKSKTAKNICNKGYCASKDLHYYGVKFHLFADRNEHKLAIPRHLSITKASVHDLTAVRNYLNEFEGHKVLGDKAYSDKALKNELYKKGVELHTPVKLSRSKKSLDEAEKLYSEIVSSVRQSIEIFFNWIIEKTNIQKASKVRSENGLMKHIFGRFAAALVSLKFNF